MQNEILNAEQQLADDLDIRGPYIQNRDLELILKKAETDSQLRQFASGVLAARMAA